MELTTKEQEIFTKLLCKDNIQLNKENKQLKEQIEKLKVILKQLKVEKEMLKEQKQKLINKSNMIELWIKENLTYSENETTSFRYLLNDFENWIDEQYGTFIKINLTEVKEYLVSYQEKCPLGFKEGINGTNVRPIVNLIIND